MEKIYDLLDIDLKLFDGGAAGAAGEGTSATGGTQAGSVDTQQGRSASIGGPRRMEGSDGEKPKAAVPPVSSRRQTEAAGRRPPNASVTAGGGADGAAPEKGSDAGSGKQTKTETPEERVARYKALVGGEFKDLFTADTQRIIDQRFKETKGLQESLAAQRPVMDFLMSKYQAKDPAGLFAAIQADESQWQAMADAAGKTVEQFKTDWFAEQQRKDMEAELAAVRREQFTQRKIAEWTKEAEEVQKTYPDFLFEQDIKDREFAALLRAGVPMKLAYEVRHMPDIVAGAAQKAADEREKAVTEAIRARGARPAENGTSAQNPVAVTTDVSKMTREERAEVARRAAKGEKITFRPSI